MTKESLSPTRGAFLFELFFVYSQMIFRIDIYIHYNGYVIRKVCALNFILFLQLMDRLESGASSLLFCVQDSALRSGVRRFRSVHLQGHTL